MTERVTAEVEAIRELRKLAVLKLIDNIAALGSKHTKLAADARARLGC